MIVLLREILGIYIRQLPLKTPGGGLRIEADGLTAWGHDQTSNGGRQAHVLSLSIHLSFHLGSVWF
jgi:hypothetical protein